MFTDYKYTQSYYYISKYSFLLYTYKQYFLVFIL